VTEIPQQPATKSAESSTAGTAGNQRSVGKIGVLAASSGALDSEMQNEPKRRRVSDGAATPILPDCCNLGIVVRVFLILNAGMLVMVVLLGEGVQLITQRLIDAAVVLEPTILISLGCLCTLRGVVNGWPKAMQWATVLGVPGLAAAATTIALGAFGMNYGTTQGWNLSTAPFVRGLAAIAIAGALIEYFRLRARAFSPSLSEARLQALQARIRPHFLFNSLNTVLGLMRSSPRVAETTLENLAELFRVFMRDTRELVPLQDEIETCRQYLAIEQLRLGERLKINWQIAGAPGDALLPSLLLQPLVENSVHHGIEPSSAVGIVTIKVSAKDDRIHIEVLNPIPESQPTRPGNQMALSNVRERLMLLYDMEADLKTEVLGEQFRLTLEFPYRKERRRRDVRSSLINPDS
jgi:two-component system, LytTR family, sensor histidine kinase AlgZ